MVKSKSDSARVELRPIEWKLHNEASKPYARPAVRGSFNGFIGDQIVAQYWLADHEDGIHPTLYLLPEAFKTIDLGNVPFEVAKKQAVQKLTDFLNMVACVYEKPVPEQKVQNIPFMSRSEAQRYTKFRVRYNGHHFLIELKERWYSGWRGYCYCDDRTEVDRRLRELRSYRWAESTEIERGPLFR